MTDQNLKKATTAAEQQAYKELVSQTKPKPPVVRNGFWAFVVGGLICVIGQLLISMYSTFGLGRTESFAATSATLIFVAALLTGLGVYDSIGKFAGAGSIVPITGFANSMVAPALEFKREGMVIGTAKLFTIAGPVLVYGFVASFLIGLIYYLVG